MDIEVIKRMLPHRYPFLLLDRVDKIVENNIFAVKNVTANENFFQGHFPARPVMPGVLLVESVVQAGVVLVLAKQEEENKVAYLTDIEKAKFRRMVIPGDVMNISARLLSIKKNIAKLTGEVFVENKLCVKLIFTVILQWNISYNSAYIYRYGSKAQIRNFLLVLRYMSDILVYIEEIQVYEKLLIN